MLISKVISIFLVFASAFYEIDSTKWNSLSTKEIIKFYIRLKLCQVKTCEKCAKLINIKTKNKIIKVKNGCYKFLNNGGANYRLFLKCLNFLRCVTCYLRCQDAARRNHTNCSGHMHQMNKGTNTLIYYRKLEMMVDLWWPNPVLQRLCIMTFQFSMFDCEGSFLQGNHFMFFSREPFHWNGLLWPKRERTQNLPHFFVMVASWET